LNKRENYRRAFDHFHPRKVARYDQAEVAELLSNPGIVRNRLKVAAAVQNARAFLALQDEFSSFDAYVWQFVGSTICYAFMQAVGMVNDHVVNCFRYQEVQAIQRKG
jgi:DNA-3-methyladenine glycosylase I